MRRAAATGLVCAAIAVAMSTAGTSFAARLGIFQQHKDIGVTPKKGKAKYKAKKDEYVITGGGANIWAKTDAFQYVYKQISGDVTLTADVHFLGQGVEAHRKATLMIRQSLDPDSAYADVALHGAGLTSLQYRPAASEDTQEIQSKVNAPEEIRIERHGNQFTIQAGSKSGELTASGPVTVNLQDPVYIGLAVCSHNAGVLETAVFANVKLEQGQPTAGRLRVLRTPFSAEGM
jgi:regulation of enolase protein 1 (concanavalin A-like superfamily)